MIDFRTFDYYIRPGVTDMRKGPHSLAAIVMREMGLTPYDGRSVFLFCGRSRKTVKAIFWDRNGWYEIAKRLECREGFKWPQTEESARRVTLDQVLSMLEGGDSFRRFPVLGPEVHASAD